MKCKDCGGEVVKGIRLVVMTGCRSSRAVYPCADCNRLHFENGETVYSGSRDKAFYEDNQIVTKDKNGEVIHRM